MSEAKPGAQKQMRAQITALIKQGLNAREDWHQIHERLKEQGVKITQKLLKTEMERLVREKETKGRAKREGAAIVQDFLAKAKNGADVERMSAVLEQALYWDILRRYAGAEDVLVSMTMEQALKLELSYRTTRLKTVKAATDTKNSDDVARLSARVCMATFEKIVDMATGPARQGINKMRAGLTKWASDEFGKNNIMDITNEQNELERLTRLMGKHGAGQNGTSKARAPLGLVS